MILHGFGFPGQPKIYSKSAQRCCKNSFLFFLLNNLKLQFYMKNQRFCMLFGSQDGPRASPGDSGTPLWIPWGLQGFFQGLPGDPPGSPRAPPGGDLAFPEALF